MNALEIRSGAELLAFEICTARVGPSIITVLTGWEVHPGRCWFCGAELAGRQRHYCPHHGAEYRRHFEWGPARQWAIERADYRCANCESSGDQEIPIYSSTNILLGVKRRTLEVHHIVPLQGGARFYSPFNLPWNLIVLCHDCHVAVGIATRAKSTHADMRQLPMFREVNV